MMTCGRPHKGSSQWLNNFKLREGVFQALLREMCLSDDSLSVCQNIEERIDIGVAVLEPSAGKISRYLIDIIYLTSYISNWLLYVLCNCRYKVDWHSELPLLFVQHSWWPVRLLLRFWFPRPKRVPDPAKKSPLAGIVQVCGVDKMILRLW